MKSPGWGGFFMGMAFPSASIVAFQPNTVTPQLK
jgi:hypothetical protein